MNFLTALIPLIAGFTQPLKDYFNYKQQITQKEQDYKLALLQSQVEQAKASTEAETSQLQSRLEATTKEFKQNTFYLLCLPVLFTMFFPKRASEMWANFALIPEFIQWLFLSVYSAIWGIPIVKGGYGAVTDLLQQRRDYKLEVKKAQYNRKAVFDTIRTLFPKGMSQKQVEIISKALDAGETEE